MNSRWRAPTEQGATLVAPSWEALPQLVENNQKLLQAAQFRVSDLEFQDVRRRCRNEAVALSDQWMTQFSESAPIQKNGPLIATGHQPELQHPGVIAKNFAAFGLAKKLGGTGLNLIVDSDIAKATSLTLPRLGDGQPDLVLNSSHASPPLPYEEWQCDDESLFASMMEHAGPVLESWSWKPLLPDFWNKAVGAQGLTKNIPMRWQIARHTLEEKWGIANYELVMSSFCTCPSFGVLLFDFIQRRAELAQLYNEEADAYRKRHRIRSKNHPVANLVIENDLIELPFWAWYPGSTQRGRLFAQSFPAGIELVVHHRNRQERIPGRWPTAASAFMQAWKGLLETKWKIRPKALITTMIIRLFIADLFIHGIGGAVYDELTNIIFHRFYGVKLPDFAVVTATLRLPWDQQLRPHSTEAQLRHLLRDLRWNPDRHLNEPAQQESLVLQSTKRRLMAAPLESMPLHERFTQFRALNEELQPFVEPERQATESTLHEVRAQTKRQAHLMSREYAWVLYPEKEIKELAGRFVSR